MMNNRLFVKKLAVLLILVALVFTSCTEDEPTDTTESNTNEPDTELSSEHTEERILPNLQAYDVGYDMEKGVLRVLTEDFGPQAAVWNSRDIAAEEETGNALNDAVYRRNRTIEEKYNFTVEQIFASDYAVGELRTAAAAGEVYFDVLSSGILGITQAAQEGLLADLFTLTYLDLEKPWWDQNAVSGMSIGKRLFFISGDSVLVNRDACPAVLFNKQLRVNLQLENPYELVRNGQWTLDKMFNMARVAAADLDGDSVLSSADRFGFATPPLGVNNLTLGIGAGVHIVDKDANDLPVLVFESEKTFNIMQAVNEFLGSDSVWRGGDIFIGAGSTDTIDGHELAFSEGRILFLATQMLSVENMRGTDADFGILPLPWFDENQREWRHSVDYFWGKALAVPNIHDGDTLDRIGFMLEAVAAESKYTVIPAHYDIQLQGQFLRDEESSEMLDIIFGSIVWDPGVVYNWFNTISTGGNSIDISASGFEKSRHLVEAAMQRTVEALADAGK
jgi:hypothetical protein